MLNDLRNVDLADLDLERITRLPVALQAGLCAVIFVLILLLLYAIDTRGQQTALLRAQDSEIALRAAFEEKQAKAVNLDAYRAQVNTLKDRFTAMLSQLPNKNEVPALLEDVSKSGTAAGLQFTLFEPANEKKEDFYAQLPIQIEVLGNYAQFARFVSRVASLDRIVTLHDFSIKANKPADKMAAQAASGAPTPPPLKMTLTAKTYRYNEPASAPASPVVGGPT